MFGFRGGETDEVVARKKGYMGDAQKKWPFLTSIDCVGIKTPGQLRSIVKVRMGIPESQAAQNVDSWMAGKQF